jgi:putative transposase
MGMQVSCGVDTEMSQETVVWGVAKYLGSIFHRLAKERESRIVKGHLCPDHVHMLIEIPPKYSVAQVVGYIKGKSAIAIARRFVGRQKTSPDKTSGREGMMCER